MKVPNCGSAKHSVPYVQSMFKWLRRTPEPSTHSTKGSDPVRHLQRARVLMMAGTPEQAEKAYMHISHALHAEAQTRKASFGVILKLKVLGGRFEIPPQIIKMIAEALKSRDALWALMQTSAMARFVLKSFVIPKEWFYQQYSAPPNHIFRNGLVLKNTDGLVAWPDIQVFIRTRPERLIVTGGYLRTVRPLQCKVPVSTRTTVLDVCNRIVHCIPEADGARLEAYRAEKIEHRADQIIQRAEHPLQKDTPVILDALGHANDTLWIDVHLADTYNDEPTVRDFIIRQRGGIPEKSAYNPDLTDDEYLEWKQHVIANKVKRHYSAHALPATLEELRRMPRSNIQDSHDREMLLEVLYDSKKQAVADDWDVFPRQI